MFSLVNGLLNVNTLPSIGKYTLEYGCFIVSLLFHVINLHQHKGVKEKYKLSSWFQVSAWKASRASWQACLVTEAELRHTVKISALSE